MEGFLLNDTDWINDFKEKRTQYGVSQNQLAVMAGVSREYVSRLESGKVALTEEIKGKFTDALDKLNPDNPLEMVLDYVRIRFPTQDVKHVVEDILKLRLDVMIHEDFGFYDFAHLLFSDGDVEQSISLDRQLNIIQVADLVLPDKDTKFEEYTTMELLSVAMLIVISTFALDFIHSDRSIFKMVDLDEAWTFLQVAQGKALSNKLIRAGRSMNAAVYFVTQNSGDVDDEKMKNNIGLKFAFRSTDIKEIKNTLEFFGVDKEDEGNQKRLRDLENGQCLFQDLYGRVGVIQIHPVFADLFHAFDTRPPVQTEEMR